MELAARLDHYGRPAWIAIMVLGFIIFWPIGLAILAYLIWSGRMGCWTGGGAGRWHNKRGSDRYFGGRRAKASSGNSAFDEYREETLHRLEDEQKEFTSFLDRLRHAKDKAEFDQFMADRSRRPEDPDLETDRGVAPQPQPQPQG